MKKPPEEFAPRRWLNRFVRFASGRVGKYDPDGNDGNEGDWNHKDLFSVAVFW